MADPRFPPGGGANSPGGGGRQHTILSKFPKNCMKLKEFGPQAGGDARPKFYYVDPPLIILIFGHCRTFVKFIWAASGGPCFFQKSRSIKKLRKLKIGCIIVAFTLHKNWPKVSSCPSFSSDLSKAVKFINSCCPGMPENLLPGTCGKRMHLWRSEISHDWKGCYWRQWTNGTLYNREAGWVVHMSDSKNAIFFHIMVVCIVTWLFLKISSDNLDIKQKT